MFKNGSIDEITKWINAAETEYSARQSDYEEARDYYENKQAPEDVPSNVSYVIKNLIWDWVNRQVAKFINGKITPQFVTTDEMADAVKELALDILEENQFQERLLEKAGNLMFVEGLGGFKINFEQYELGPYGLGMPRIYILKPTELLLDPNASDGSHADDRARAMRTRIPVSEAKQRWPKYADQIAEYSRGFEFSGNETEPFCDLYEVEFYLNYLVPVRYDVLSGQYKPIWKFNPETLQFDVPEDFEGYPEGVPLLNFKVFFVTKVINRELQVEKPQPTGYDGFTIIPFYHTVSEGTVKLPIPPIKYLKDTQDRINVISSIMLETSKRSVKNPVIVTGASEADISVVKRKIAGIGEVIIVQSPNANVITNIQQQLPTHLIQQYELDRRAFEEITSSFAPDRGEQIEGSGKKVLALQMRSDMTMSVPKKHIEAALVELFRRLVETITRKMITPFVLERSVGEGIQRIPFNMPEQEAGIDEEAQFAVVKEIKGQRIVNPVTAFSPRKIKVDVQLDTLGKEEIELNKAFTLSGAGKLSTEDLLKIAYPNSWEIKLKNLREENQVLQLAAEIAELGPDVMQQVQAILQAAKVADAALQKQRQGQNTNIQNQEVPYVG